MKKYTVSLDFITESDEHAIEINEVIAYAVEKAGYKAVMVHRVEEIED